MNPLIPKEVPKEVYISQRQLRTNMITDILRKQDEASMKVASKQLKPPKHVPCVFL